MRRIRYIVGQTWDKLLVFCGMLCVMLPISPLNMRSINKDSGVFLYIGWRILNGELPYRDVWDHKPPIIFYLNALGLAISNNSRWGVWFIECIGLFIAAFIGFRLMKKTFGILPAVFSLLIWLLTLNILIRGGNFTEEYALPAQFAALWLISNANGRNFRDRHWFLIGLLGAIAFFTKQTTVGIWIATIFYFTIQRSTAGQLKRWLHELLIIIMGALPICIGIVVFFYVQGGLSQFWSAAFKYNFIYPSAIGFLPKIKYIAASGITNLALVPTAIFYFSILGYFVGLILILFKKTATSEWLPLLPVGLIALPIELILVSISGRNYTHYYISMLPTLSLFVGLMFWMFLSQLSTYSVSTPAKYVFFIGVTGIILLSSFRDYHAQVSAYSKANDDTVINYIKSVTTPDDYVLFWGAESVDNYLTQRRSPTRFVYQFPLYQQRYTNEQMIAEFLEEVIRNHPSLIIDTKNVLTPMYRFMIQTPAINTDIAYIQSHYRFQENIGSWSIYTFVGDTNNP